MTPVDWSAIRHFTEEEFRCKCGCGRADMDHHFVKRLDDMREYLDFPIPITSGYRCPDHNQEVSSTGRNGPHTTGKAADLGLSRQRARKALTTAAMKFNGLGINQKGEGRFLHVDSLNYRIWTY